MKISIIAVSTLLSINAFATTEAQVRSTKNRIEPVLAQVKGVNGIGISECYVGTDKLIRPGTLPASELCISVGFESEEALASARGTFNSPFKVNGVGVAFYFLGTIHPQ